MMAGKPLRNSAQSGADTAATLNDLPDQVARKLVAALNEQAGYNAAMRHDDCEFLSADSDVQVVLAPCTNQFYRVTHIMGSTPTGATGVVLWLGSKKLPLPAGNFSFVIGSDRSGGIVLKASDQRKLVITSAAGALWLALGGQVVPETHRW